MELVQDRLRQAQRGRKQMADARAMEKQAQRPQLAAYDNEPEPTMEVEGAGLDRVVGAGKRRSKKAAAAPAPVMESDEGTSRRPRVAEAGMDKAEEEGVAFARHLKQLKGKKFFDAFHKGLMSGGAACMSGGAEEEESESDKEEVVVVESGEGSPRRQRVAEGGRRRRKVVKGGAELPPMPIVPPGGVRARTRGNPPQSPATFERNSVSLDVAAREEDAVPATAGAGTLHITHDTSRGGRASASAEGGKRKSANRSARGQMIAKLMREEGLTLPQASKKLKEMKA